MKDEIIIYQADQISTRLEVRIDNETVWLSMEQIGILFNRNRTVVNRHINNIFKEGELNKEERLSQKPTELKLYFSCFQVLLTHDVWKRVFFLIRFVKNYQ